MCKCVVCLNGQNYCNNDAKSCLLDDLWLSNGTKWSMACRRLWLAQFVVSSCHGRSIAFGYSTFFEKLSLAKMSTSDTISFTFMNCGIIISRLMRSEELSTMSMVSKSGSYPAISESAAMVKLQPKLLQRARRPNFMTNTSPKHHFYISFQENWHSLSSIQ